MATLLSKKIDAFYLERFGSMGKPPAEDVPPFNEMMDFLLKVPQTAWIRYAFAREPLRHRFDDVLRNEIADEAIACGREYAEQYIKTYGKNSAQEAARDLGIKINIPLMPSESDRVLYAQFVEPDEIQVYQDCLNKADDLYRKYLPGIALDEENIKEILIAHELFHYAEMKDKDTIFSLNKKIILWSLGPFKHSSKIICLSELAAMSFAQTFKELSFSPYLLDVYLTYAYNKEAANALFAEIRRHVRKDL